MEISVKMKLVIRLQIMMEERHRIDKALERLEGIEDDDFSPSSYTPSRHELASRLDDLGGRVAGFCEAMDIVWGMQRAAAEKVYYKMMDDESAPYLLTEAESAVPDSDADYTAQSLKPAYERIMAELDAANAEE
jgi:hypothetical protein